MQLSWCSLSIKMMTWVYTFASCSLKKQCNDNKQTQKEMTLFIEKDSLDD